MKKIINYLFPLIKEIKSKSGELHFQRYRIFTFYNLFSIYFHIVYKKDDDEHLHNHPWSYIHIPLKGFYLEKTENDTINKVKPFMIIKRHYMTYHKIHYIVDSPCYSLFIVGKRKNALWSYIVDNKEINHIEYRKLKHSK